MCVAIPFVLVTIAPRFITAAEVNLFFLLETILGPIWVWMVIKEQPSNETIYGGVVIILTIAIQQVCENLYYNRHPKHHKEKYLLKKSFQ